MEKQDLLLTPDEEYKFVHRSTNMNISTRRFMTNKASLKATNAIINELTYCLINNTERQRLEAVVVLHDNLDKLVKEIENE